jgi:hypothetical protein
MQLFSVDATIFKKQARKGFRPLSAMYGIGYFQNLMNFLKNCLEIFWIVLEFSGEFFVRNFLGEMFWEDFFGRNFLGGFFGRNFQGGIFWEEFFGRNSLFTLLKSAKLFEY